MCFICDASRRIHPVNGVNHLATCHKLKELAMKLTAGVTLPVLILSDVFLSPLFLSIQHSL